MSTAKYIILIAMGLFLIWIFVSFTSQLGDWNLVSLDGGYIDIKYQAETQRLWIFDIHEVSYIQRPTWFRLFNKNEIYFDEDAFITHLCTTSDISAAIQSHELLLFDGTTGMEIEEADEFNLIGDHRHCIETEDGKVVVRGEHGLVVISDDAVTYLDFPHSLESGWRLIKNFKKELWIYNTKSGVVYGYDGEEWLYISEYPVDVSSLDGTGAGFLEFISSDNYLWIDTWLGLYRIPPGGTQDDVEKVFDLVDHDLVKQVFEDKNGVIWIVSSENVRYLTGDKLTRIEIPGMVSLIWGASFDFEREILFISGRSGIYSLDVNEAKELITSE